MSKILKYDACPKCGKFPINKNECLSCGIIFAKYKKNEIKSNHNNEKSSTASNKPQSIFFTIASILLLFIILLDGLFVYNNEFTRPKRERYYSTLDLIETSFIQNKFEELTHFIDYLHDRNKRSSIIFKRVEDGCNEISNGVVFNKTNNYIRCIFQDNSFFHILQ